MRRVPADVDDSREYGAAPFPVQVLYQELRGVRVPWSPGETCGDAVHRAAARRGIRRTASQIAADLDVALERELAGSTVAEGGGGEVEFYELPPSVAAARQARKDARAARAQRAAARRGTTGAQGGHDANERQDRRRHPERYPDWQPGRPGRPPKTRDNNRDENRDNNRDNRGAAPVTVFVPGAHPPPPSPGPLRGTGEEERGSAGEAVTVSSGAPVTDSQGEAVTDFAVVETGGGRRFRAARELGALDDRALGAFVIGLLAEGTEAAFLPHADDEERRRMGDRVRAFGFNAEELWRVAECWRSVPGVVARMFQRSGARRSVTVGFLLDGERTPARHLRDAVAYAGSWFLTLPADVRATKVDRRLGLPGVVANTVQGAPDDRATRAMFIASVKDPALRARFAAQMFPGEDPPPLAAPARVDDAVATRARASGG